MRGDRREEEDARGDEETPKTSKLKPLDQTGPVWRIWGKRKVLRKEKDERENSYRFVFDGDPKIFTKDDKGDERSC